MKTITKYPLHNRGVGKFRGMKLPPQIGGKLATPFTLPRPKAYPLQIGGKTRGKETSPTIWGKSTEFIPCRSYEIVAYVQPSIDRPPLKSNRIVPSGLIQTLSTQFSHKDSLKPVILSWDRRIAM